MKQSCAARMLDIRGYVLAARGSMAQADPAAAIGLIFVFGLIALCLLPLWVAYDLNSTWVFTTSLRESAAPVIEGAAYDAGGVLGMSVAAALAGFILTAFTLLPSLFELAFPAVQHPLLNLVLWGSIIFDFTTDWGKSWETTAAWSDNPLVHALFAAAFCLFMSVMVQALLVVCVTVVIFGLLSLAGVGRRGAVVMER